MSEVGSGRHVKEPVDSLSLSYHEEKRHSQRVEPGKCPIGRKLYSILKKGERDREMACHAT